MTPRRSTRARFALLESKLSVPRRRQGLISRALLVDRLRRARRTPVVSVNAPAGYGKTTAFSEWVLSDPRTVAWYSIDSTDIDATVFLTYLASAMSRAGADVASVFGKLAAAEPAIGTATARLGAALAALDPPAIVVLDNVHHLTAGPCLDALITLLHNVPTRSQLVLIGRGTSHIPLERLRAEGRLFELGLDDLRLSTTEAGGLLGATGVALDDDDLNALNARCEGWPAGLYLAALILRRTGRPPENAPLGSDKFISDYFHAELLDHLPAADRNFLLQISVVERLSGPLCDYMLAQSGTGVRLRAFAAANLFIVPLDDRGEWYRLHPLFREALESELARRDGHRPRSLLRRAADWYEGQGDLDSAIECAIAAGESGRVSALCAAAALPAYWSGRSATVERWFSAIDDSQLLAKHPPVAVIGAAMNALWGRPRVAERWAAAAFRSDPDELMPDGSRAGAWVAILRALLCENGVAAMRADAQLALDTLSDASDFRSSAYLFLGFAHLLGGSDERATECLERTVEVARGLGATVGECLADAGLSLLAAARGDRQSQATYAREAVSIVDAAHLEEYVTSALVYAVSGRAALAHGYRSRAEEDIARADSVVEKLTYALPWIAVPARLELARLHLAFERPSRARDLLDEVTEILGRRPSLGVAVERAAQLRQELDAGRAPDAGWASTLTAAELRLLPLLASHLSLREIAERLGISRNTVKTQAIAVYRKLDVSSRSDAVRRAQESELLRETSQLE